MAMREKVHFYTGFMGPGGVPYRHKRQWSLRQNRKFGLRLRRRQPRQPRQPRRQRHQLQRQPDDNDTNYNDNPDDNDTNYNDNPDDNDTNYNDNPDDNDTNYNDNPDDNDTYYNADDVTAGNTIGATRSSYANYEAERAVDGDNATYSSTMYRPEDDGLKDPLPWWRIDLEKTVTVVSVWFHGFTSEKYPSRNHNLIVKIGTVQPPDDQSGDGVTCDEIKNDEEHPDYLFKCPAPGILGRFVIIQRTKEKLEGDCKMAHESGTPMRFDTEFPCRSLRWDFIGITGWDFIGITGWDFIGITGWDFIGITGWDFIGITDLIGHHNFNFSEVY
uniref:Fucolectin tachylectin-4 pentraxin-1 domain-containing protein n=1 Tax=Strigamia maritima TaxID=126957 RepID=T1IHE2_STRMM